MKSAVCFVILGLATAVAPGALAQSAVRYPDAPANKFKADVTKSIVVIDQSKVVYTEEFMANSCLIGATQQPDNKQFSERTINANGRIKLTPALAKFYDECLASNGFAYQPKPPARPAKRR